MSATGRSDVRRADDFYSTPDWCTRAILPHFEPFDSVLDPCAGDGAILKVVTPRKIVHGFELNSKRVVECDRDLIICWNIDSLDPELKWCCKLITQLSYDLIITNPPYSLAQQFIEKAIDSNAHQIAMLLRLNYLGSQKRASFWKKHPCDIYVLPKRPSFTGTGTDATEYAWFVWTRDVFSREWYILDV